MIISDATYETLVLRDIQSQFTDLQDDFETVISEFVEGNRYLVEFDEDEFRRGATIAFTYLFCMVKTAVPSAYLISTDAMSEFASSKMVDLGSVAAGPKAWKFSDRYQTVWNSIWAKFEIPLAADCSVDYERGRSVFADELRSLPAIIMSFS